MKIHRARYCGTNRPSTVTSEGSDHEISITYKFNGKTRYPGFKRSATSKREYSFSNPNLLKVQIQFSFKRMPADLTTPVSRGGGGLFEYVYKEAILTSKCTFVDCPTKYQNPILESYFFVCWTV